jgi:hypothetical protein
MVYCVVCHFGELCVVKLQSFIFKTYFGKNLSVIRHKLWHTKIGFLVILDKQIEFLVILGKHDS